MPRKLPNPRPYLPLVTLRRAWLVAPAALLLPACGPSVEDRGDVYPRNCGLEGPVELLAITTPAYGGEVRRAGEHYLLEHWPGPMTREHWALERCGEAPVLLGSGPYEATPHLGTAGEHILSCDDATGAMAYVDPSGVEPPRPLFPAVEGCRVVPLGKGLAAQERGGGTVWFHPDPSDPEQEVQVVTRDAQPTDIRWVDCSSLQLDCESWHPFGIDIRAAGDELLVVLESEELLAFSSTSLESRILDPGPVFALDVLPGERQIVVDRELQSPTLIVDRLTGSTVEFCCWSDWEPIQLFGDWLVQGSFHAPYGPEPAAWTNFEAYHMPSGTRTVVEGRERWSVIARLTSDTILVDISPHDSSDYERHVVWLATGERQPVDIPGDDAWTTPGRDGVYVMQSDGDGNDLRYLGGPGEAPRLLLEDARIAFATKDGRIVFEPAYDPSEPLEPRELSVMLPDQRVVVLEEQALGAVGTSFYSERWPLDRDEVLYSVKDGDAVVLQRTVLP